MLTEPQVREILAVEDTISTSTLQGTIDRAVAFVETQTHRYFGPPQSVTEVLTGSGNYLLRLSDKPRVALTIDILERSSPGATPVTVPTTAFSLRTQATTADLVRTDTKVWRLGYEYTVQYQRGYTTSEGPDEIDQLLLDLVSLSLGGLDGVGVESERLGDYSQTRAMGDWQQLVPMAHATLNTWRKRVVA